MNTGDLFDWVYKNNNEHVAQNERLWSNTLKQWVQIDSLYILVSVSNDVRVFLTHKGLFHAHVDDIARDGAFGCTPTAVVPRTRG